MLVLFNDLFWSLPSCDAIAVAWAFLSLLVEWNALCFPDLELETSQEWELRRKDPRDWAIALTAEQGTTVFFFFLEKQKYFSL